MNLNDLFEMGIADVPPALRRKLTPADVAPKSSPVAGSVSGKFRVIPPNSDFDIKDFDDQRSATEYARLVGGKVQTLSEQEDPNSPGTSPRARGTRNIVLIDKTKNTTEPVIIDLGTAKYSLTAPEDKKWFLNVWYGMRKNGRGDRFLDMMGDEKGFEYLHDMFAAHHVQKQQQQQNRAQKKRSKALGERDEGTPARTQRLLDKIRLQYPQAQNDQEAMVYAFMDYNKKTKDEIDKLEKQHDDIEKDVKRELEKSIGDLGSKRGAVNNRLKQISTTNTRQDQLISQLLKIDQEQQQALDDLKSTVTTVKEPQRDKVTVGQRPAINPTVGGPVVNLTPAVGPVPPPTIGATAGMTKADAAAASDAAMANVKAKSIPAEPEPKPEVKPMINVPPRTSARPKDGKAQQSIPLGQPQTPARKQGTVTPIRSQRPAANQAQGTLQKVAERIGIRGLGEQKNKTIPGNKKLWEQALDKARVKFNLFPSTDANSWAAKWYKNHGGKWDKKQ